MKDRLTEWLEDVERCWQTVPKAQINPEKLKHLSIICDGNRRAARARGVEPYLGHQVGVEVIKGIARAGRKWDIKALTFWVWSTENWSRDTLQTDFVMGLAKDNLSRADFQQELQENSVHFRQIGRRDRLPTPLQEILLDLERRTQTHDRFFLNLALDYGGVDEMSRAVLRMFLKHLQGSFDPAKLQDKPETIYQYLDTFGQPLPDLVIRTGNVTGEIPHTSGFMPLQTAYAGWDFIPTLFPDMTPKGLLSSVNRFLGYERRKGR